MEITGSSPVTPTLLKSHQTLPLRQPVEAGGTTDKSDGKRAFFRHPPRRYLGIPSSRATVDVSIRNKQGDEAKRQAFDHIVAELFRPTESGDCRCEIHPAGIAEC